MMTMASVSNKKLSTLRRKGFNFESKKKRQAGKRCKSISIKPWLRKTSPKVLFFSERFKYQWLHACGMRKVAAFAFGVSRRWDVFFIFSRISHLMFHVTWNDLTAWNNKRSICHGWHLSNKKKLNHFRIIGVILFFYNSDWQTGHRYHCLLFWCPANFKEANKMQIALVFCARSEPKHAN